MEVPELLIPLLEAGVKIHLEHKQLDQMSEEDIVFVISGPVEGMVLEMYKQTYEDETSFAIDWQNIHSYEYLLWFACSCWDGKQPLLKEWEDLFLTQKLIKTKEYYVKST